MAVTEPRPAGRDTGAGVLFIGGWGRSGSTLLERLLGSVAGTVSVGELRDVWQRGATENRLCGCGEPFLQCPVWTAVGQKAFGGWDALDVAGVHRLRRRVDRPWMVPFLLAPRLAPPRLRADVREYADVLAVLLGAIADVGGGGLVVESSKIPSFSLLLRRAGVRQRVVHLVRDSRGVVHSWRKLVERIDAGEEPDLMYRYGTVSASLRYLGYNAMTHLLQGPGRPYRRYRYEDLASDPAGVLEDLAAFADLRLDAGLRSQLRWGTVDLATTHTVDGNPMRLRTGATVIRPDDDWRRELPAVDRRTVSALTWPLLLLYGYRGGRPAGPRAAAARGPVTAR